MKKTQSLHHTGFYELLCDGAGGVECLSFDCTLLLPEWSSCGGSPLFICQSGG
jgi:hypothetical protein